MVKDTEQKATESPFLNVLEAAKYLRLTRSTLDGYRWDGRGPKYRKHGNKVYYHRDELNRWSENRRYRNSSQRG